ncbi:hypothetical protein [Cellvibrio sp. UBA7671]|uniref:hypothetical protein n=1 Tax=Cellvibrio sp. UBA7671 TaxID=1946312 RepID=UPI002F3606C3
MTYRPLNHNERVVVSRVIYEERGLSGGLAESMFMAYTGRALALDAPEFDIFQESEIERKARLAEKQREKVIELNAGAELEPMEFLSKLEALSKNDKPSKDPLNCFEWFYGDENALDTRHKRLRVKFYNSPKYRQQALRRYLEDGILEESQLANTELVGQIIGEFHRKYPGTRQGIISYYETLFGDPSGFSYQCAKEREAFNNDPLFRAALLKKLRLDEGLSTHDVRESLKKSALETGVVTPEQIAQWEVNS